MGRIIHNGFGLHRHTVQLVLGAFCTKAELRQLRVGVCAHISRAPRTHTPSLPHLLFPADFDVDDGEDDDDVDPDENTRFNGGSTKKKR